MLFYRIISVVAIFGLIGCENIEWDCSDPLTPAEVCPVEVPAPPTVVCEDDAGVPESGGVSHDVEQGDSQDTGGGDENTTDEDSCDPQVQCSCKWQYRKKKKWRVLNCKCKKIVVYPDNDCKAS